MGLIERLTGIGNAMRSGDGETKLYTLPEMAQRPGVWQQTIAEAITAKGVDTLPDSNFDTMAINIGLIPSGSGDSKVFEKTLTMSPGTSITTLVSQNELFDAGLISSLSANMADEWDDVKIVLYYTTLANIANSSTKYITFCFLSSNDLNITNSNINGFTINTQRTTITAVAVTGLSSTMQNNRMFYGPEYGIRVYATSTYRIPGGTAKLVVVATGKK